MDMDGNNPNILMVSTDDEKNTNKEIHEVVEEEEQPGNYNNKTLTTNDNDDTNGANKNNYKKNEETEKTNKDDDEIGSVTEVGEEDDSEDNSNDNDYGDVSYRPSIVQLYSLPQQRQYWDDEQILPRVNVGDLFFDLFYVGATYNVSNIIVYNPDRFGFLYACATYWSVQGINFHRALYDSRFITNTDDVYHSIFQFITLLVVSIAVLSIRPVHVLSNSATYISMFLYCLMLIINQLLFIIRYIEVYYKGIGKQPTLKITAKRDILSNSLPLPFYITAAVIAGLDYFSSNNNNEYEEYNVGKESNYNNYNTSSDYNSTTVSDATSNNDGSHFRWLAAAVSETNKNDANINHVPIYLLLFGYIAGLIFYGTTIICCFPNDGSHKERAIPLNVNFSIHRQSEWIMLNLGESIFSIVTIGWLIVIDDKVWGTFYTTFYCSVLSVILLHELHFQSQPHEADHHAIRRNKNAGFIFFMLTHIYSLALVSLGAGYTLFLIEASKSNDYEDKKYSKRIAQLFSLSLALIFACLDSMILCHIGIKKSKDLCICPETKQWNIKGYILIAFRVALILFTATLDLWEQNPKLLSIIGLILVFIQIMSRKASAKCFITKAIQNALPSCPNAASAAW